MKFLLGKKLGMTTLQDAEKGALNVTLIECPTNTVKIVRTPEVDGYSAVQIEIAKTSKRLMRREFRLDTHQTKEEALADATNYITEQVLGVDAFAVGDKVAVTGITKAKGFQGVVKRHGFKGAPASHGHKDQERMPGSIGSTEPQHVIKGMRMAGRMGGVKATSPKLKVVMIDVVKQLIAVQGAVPGINGGVVAIRTIRK
ncbi:MAG: 50S ribosomal protein L3 [Candidatus Moraniibacteriota bacterium]